jgi:hypothetical protein
MFRIQFLPRSETTRSECLTMSLSLKTNLHLIVTEFLHQSSEQRAVLLLLYRPMSPRMILNLRLLHKAHSLQRMNVVCKSV